MELEKCLRVFHLLRINCKLPAQSLETKVVSCVDYQWTGWYVDHSVKEPSKNGDIWVRFGFLHIFTFAFWFLSVQFLANPWFWFVSFLLGLSSFPSLYTTGIVTVTVGDTETNRGANGFQPRLGGLQGRIRRRAWIILARYITLSGSPNVATFIGVDLS